MDRPLSDIKVLDLTSGVCGPYCTQILRDLGADVIKVEAPAGDISRRKGTEKACFSVPYLAVNRGKKSITLDLEQESHRNVLRKLAAKTDVFVEDLGPGKAEAMLLGYSQLREINGKILYISISGYGHTGRFSHYSDRDEIIQALSGFMSVTGQLDGEYTKAGVPIADIYTGIYAAIGALSGIIHRRHTQESLFVDVAKLRVMLTLMPDSMAKYLNTGQITRPKGSKHQLAGFFQPAKAKDGYVICMAAQDHQFRAFTEVLGLEGLEKDPRFDDMVKRGMNSSILEKIIEEKTSQMTMRELSKKLLDRKIPVGSINSIPQILNDEYSEYHKNLVMLCDDKGENYMVVGFPLRFSNFELEKEMKISRLGEDTQEILQSFLDLQGEELSQILTMEKENGSHGI